EVDAHEIEVLQHIGGIEDRFGIGPDMGPWNYVDCDRRAGIFAANRGGQFLGPGAGDLGPRAVLRFLGDPLDEVEAAQFAADPARLSFLRLSADDRLVHQVVTEQGGVTGTRSGDLLPPTGLRVPAIRFVEFVVPLRNLVEPVTAQPGDVEIETV